GLSCCLRLAHYVLGTNGVGRIDKQSNARRSGYHFAQKAEPLWDQFTGEEIYSCYVAAGPVKAWNQAQPDGVVANAEDARNCRGRVFGCAGTQRETRRGDHRNSTTDQVGGEHRQSVVSALQPVVFDGDVLTFDITRFADAFTKLGHMGNVGVTCP